MRLLVHALKRSLGMGLAASLLVTAPVALASDQRGQATRQSEKPDITLHGETTATVWELNVTGRVLVDGRFARPDDRIESGSRIVVDKASMARAELKGIGRLTIAPKTEVIVDRVDDTLVAKMIQGSMKVEIAAQYGSYIETPDSRVQSYPGAFASYRVSTDPWAGTAVDRGMGDVEFLAVVDEGGYDIKVLDGDDDIYMKARKSERLQIRLKRQGNSVPNQPITFAITTALNGASGQFTDGVQRITTTTDSDGVASVDFLSGASSGMVYVEAFVPGTDAHETLHIHIEAKEKTFWNTGTTALYIALAAGAVAGTVIAIENSRGGDGDGGVTPLPPPTVTGP